jgi:uracil-DNA glycosylase family 4
MLTLFDTMEVVQEDPGEVIKELSSSCQNCRLGFVHPNNRGVIYRGNVLAKIAFVHEAPRDAETERGVALVGTHGRAFERWMRILGLDSNQDLFVTSVVQCQPPREMSGDEELQREPDVTEIGACFGSRCLRILRAMPNLQCVVTLGWVAATALLGTGHTKEERPKAKTHDGQWFETSLLPGIPVFCMPDPVWVCKNPTPDKFALIEHDLDYFKREFLEQDRITELAQAAKEKRNG